MGFSMLFLSFLEQCRQKSNFDKQSEEFREVVFYSEGSADWPHLGPVIKELLKAGQKVSYLSSEKDDIAFDLDHENFKCFFIGNGAIRTLLFFSIKAKIFIMTLPDLETYHLKKSKYAVHYIYIYHSINSTHMVYREHAFDAYDTIFCVGDHHKKEIRETEKVYGLPEKNLVNHGYGKLDDLIQKTRRKKTSLFGKKILLAPSWGTCSIIENNFSFEIIKLILESSYDLTVRLHPMTVRHHPKLKSQLENDFKEYRNFKIESNMNNNSSLYEADVLITDWSGISCEYAFVTKKPVLFLDTPKKINNSNYKKIKRKCLEDEIRFEIGEVLRMDQIEDIPKTIERLISQKNFFQKKIEKAQDSYIYNLGESAKVASLEILKIRKLLSEC